MKIAAFTIVHNERFFLPLWLKYYSQVADVIHVLDHASTDGSIEESAKHYDFQVIRIAKSFLWKYEDTNSIVKVHQALLVESYDMVIFSDVDEFMVPTAHGNLREYIEAMTESYTRCEGWDVVQDRKEEQALDLSKPILGQRMYMKRSTLYDKPLIASVPLDWSIGCHYLNSSGPKPTDASLKLFHLKLADYDVAYERASYRFPSRISEGFIMNQMNKQLVDAELIPERFKGLL